MLREVDAVPLHDLHQLDFADVEAFERILPKTHPEQSGTE
jgi:hypothetical protein